MSFCLDLPFQRSRVNPGFDQFQFCFIEGTRMVSRQLEQKWTVGAVARQDDFAPPASRSAYVLMFRPPEAREPWHVPQLAWKVSET